MCPLLRSTPYACADFFKIAHMKGHMQGILSPFTSTLTTPCPEGALCEDFEGNSEGESAGEEGSVSGVPKDAIKRKAGYFKIPWSWNGLEFYQCDETNAALGSEVERCPNGTAPCGEEYDGLFCLNCAPGHTKTSGSRCVKCPDLLQQTLEASGTGLLGLGALGLLIFNTIRSRGEPSNPIIGVSKSALRYLQLASLASNFPLQWPEPVREVFSIFTSASSVGSSAFSLSCSASGYGNAFLLESLLTFTAPIVLVGLRRGWGCENGGQGRHRWACAPAVALVPSAEWKKDCTFLALLYSALVDSAMLFQVALPSPRAPTPPVHSSSSLPSSAP